MVTPADNGSEKKEKTTAELTRKCAPVFCGASTLLINPLWRYAVGPILYRAGKEWSGLDEHVGENLLVHVLAKYLTTKNQQVCLVVVIV